MTSHSRRLVALVLAAVALVALGSCAGASPEAPSIPSSTSFTGHDGARLWYRSVDGPGDPVVVVHGGPGMDSAYLGADLEPLTGMRAVVFYDQRGAGRSELVAEPERLTMADHVADLEALRRHLGLEKLTLVAHSFGPLIAAHYAISHPDRVERMIFLGPVPPVEGDFWERFGANLGAALSEAETEAMNAAWEDFTTGDDVEAACRAFWDIALKPRLADPASRSRMKGDPCAAPPEALLHGFTVTNGATVASIAGWDLREALGSVTAPTLILHGEAEPIPMELVEVWTRALPHARLVRVPEAAHLVYIERPDIVWPEIEAFLDGEARSPETTER